MTTIDRLEENVPGAWYTTDECICCNLCGDNAPEFFKPDSDRAYHVVHRQPETPSELEIAEAARVGCPVEAIHCDGLETE